MTRRSTRPPTVSAPAAAAEPFVPGNIPPAPPAAEKPPTAAQVAEIVGGAPTVSGGWLPSARQRAAKAKLLIAARHDPLMDLATLPAKYAASYMGISEVAYYDWAKHPEFREWLTAKHETEERAQFLLDSWMAELGARMPNMVDKDFIQAGKLLADVVTKQAERAAPQEPDMAGQSPEQLKALLARLVPGLIQAAPAAEVTSGPVPT